MLQQKKEGKNLLEVCRGDSEFEQVYQKLHPTKQKILNGELELYIGECKDRGKANINYARNVAA